MKTLADRLAIPPSDPWLAIQTPEPVREKTPRMPKKYNQTIFQKRAEKIKAEAAQRHKLDTMLPDFEGEF